MNLFYERGLKKDAEYLERNIEEVFGIEIEIGLAGKLPLKYNKRVDGYEPAGGNGIFLIQKDLFMPGARSSEDDYIYGYASGDAFFISVARLKSRKDEPSKKLEVSKLKYYQRIKWVAIHELGHELIKNQKHYKEYVITNPITKYKTKTGKHCTDPKCIMSQADDLKMLDNKIKQTYDGKFCEKCKISIMNSRKQKVTVKKSGKKIIIEDWKK